jgi:hypothetical protein
LRVVSSTDQLLCTRRRWGLGTLPGRSREGAVRGGDRARTARTRPPHARPPHAPARRTRAPLPRTLRLLCSGRSVRARVLRQLARARKR